MSPILVAGTNSWKDKDDADWYCPGHPFGTFLWKNGCTPDFDGTPGTKLAKPFIWSTDLAGVPFLTKKRDWAAGGAALAYFVMLKRQRPGSATAILAHSHALQIAAYAAYEHDLKIQTLITIGSPLRADMKDQYAALRANTQYWLHLHSDGSDKWQWFGEMFDGHFGIVRETPLADKNDFVPGVGHSELLRDPAQFHYWTDRGWLNQLKG